MIWRASAKNMTDTMGSSSNAPYSNSGEIFLGDSPNCS